MNCERIAQMAVDTRRCSSGVANCARTSGSSGCAHEYSECRRPVRVHRAFVLCMAYRKQWSGKAISHIAQNDGTLHRARPRDGDPDLLAGIHLPVAAAAI